MIAVTGITGHSGGFFLRQLIDHGYKGKLRCFVRQSSDTSMLDASGLDIEKCVGNLDNYEDLCRFAAGADTVLHIAGIRLTPLLLKAIEASGSKPHVVLVHTSGIYSKYKIASEEYKEVERDMQQYLDRGMNITLLRPTMIFGDMKDHNISKFIRMVDRFPIMPEIDHGSGLIQPVNARDLWQIYYQAVMAERLPRLYYLASGQRELSLHELFDLIGQYLGKRTLHLSCPMSIGVLGAKAVRALTGGRKDLVEKVLRMGEDRCFSNEDARRELGYEPEEFDLGLKREVEEYMANGRK